MKAARVLRFDSPNAITNDDLPQPEPAVGQLLVRDCPPQINNRATALDLWGVRIGVLPRLERASLFIEKCQSLFPARLTKQTRWPVATDERVISAITQFLTLLLRHEFYPIV